MTVQVLYCGRFNCVYHDQHPTYYKSDLEAQELTCGKSYLQLDDEGKCMSYSDDEKDHPYYNEKENRNER